MVLILIELLKETLSFGLLCEERSERMNFQNRFA
jgi:hypothetical protein